MIEIKIRAEARRDLIEHYVYLAENASVNTAERFLANAQSSFNDLAHQPAMGAPLGLTNPNLAGMRKWSVKEFDRFLIFYIPYDHTISVVRVLYSAKDWWSVLGLAH